MLVSGLPRCPPLLRPPPSCPDVLNSLARKVRISSTGRNPHRPWKGVRAMAISGLWLASG